MTIVPPIFPLPNAAHEASPINGGIVQPSMEVFTSLRDRLTLKTPSSVLSAPFTPMICSIFAVSSFCALAEPQNKATRQARIQWNRIIDFMALKLNVKCRSFKLKHLLHSLTSVPCLFQENGCFCFMD